MPPGEPPGSSGHLHANLAADFVIRERPIGGDKAVAWMDKNDPKGDDLLRFRAEAAEVLGIKEPSKPELPAPPKEIKEE